jgi:hypothetical protein
LNNQKLKAGAIDIRNTFAIALRTMMRQEPAAEFASDSSSVIWMGGGQLDDLTATAIAHGAAASGMDVVYLVFDPAVPERGPKSVTVLAVRDDKACRWQGCRLWSPPQGGPALLMTTDGGCFAFDGRALIHEKSRPLKAIDAGVARARGKLRIEVAAVPANDAQDFVIFGLPNAA